MAPANQTKERSVHELRRGISEQKFNVNRACFPEEKHQNSQRRAKFHELFVLALSLVWFAGATPEKRISRNRHLEIPGFYSPPPPVLLRLGPLLPLHPKWLPQVLKKVGQFEVAPLEMKFHEIFCCRLSPKPSSRGVST